MKATTCTNHCSACGSHFSSLSAFEAHRVGNFEEGRFCEEPEDVVGKDGTSTLTPLSTSGVCQLARPPKTGVTVWTGAKSLERARLRFGEAA